MIDVYLPDWSKAIWSARRYLLLYGGRGGAKTHTLAQAAVIKGAQEPIKVICAREFQNSIDESVKTTLEIKIEAAGLSGFYDIQNNVIRGANGTEFLFKGLARNYMSIKGWEDVDILWIEEAQSVSQKSWEILRPTIRKAGSQIWLSMNRHDRNAAVDQFFFSEHGAPPDSTVIKVNYDDNPFFTKELEAERLICLETTPERYAHIWEGEPDDGASEYVVLPYAWLLKAVDAHKALEIEITGLRHAGLDPNDGGADLNGFCVRHGALLKVACEWQAEYQHQTASRAERLCNEHEVSRMFYDVTGVGAGIKSEFSKPKDRAFTVRPFKFGGKLNGADVLYTQATKNKDFFVNKQNIQAAWNLRLRLQNTVKLLDGEDVNPERCLFIDGGISDLNTLLQELCQPVYEEDSAGRIGLNKRPDGKASPNRFDAVCMAFAHDIRNGIKL